MAEPAGQSRYSSSDRPDFSTYPVSPESAAPSASHNSSHAVHDHDEQARKIGAALGRLVNRLTEFSENRLEDIEQGFDEAKMEAESRFASGKAKVSCATQQVLGQARAKAARARRLAVQTVHDHPVEVVAAAGIAGMIAGAGLRAWRQNRG